MYTILIVDDQKSIRSLLGEFFKREQCMVHLAIDGEDGVSRARDLMPDIVLMDMKMPNMNGLEAAQAILANKPEQLIIMMTAYEEKEIINQILTAGVKGYITKPFDLNELRDMVQEVLGA